MAELTTPNTPTDSIEPADLETGIAEALRHAPWRDRIKFVDHALSAGWDETTEREAPDQLCDGARQFVATVLRGLDSPPIEAFETALIYRLSGDPVHVLMSSRWLVDNVGDEAPYEDFLIGHPGLARLYALDYRLKGQASAEPA